MATKARYPEHEKLSKISDQSQVCGEFIDWLEQKGIHLAEWDSETFTRERMFPTHRSRLSLLAGFFDIDQDRIDLEKDQMLKELRDV